MSNKFINNCYTLRPVYNDSQLDEPTDFDFTHDSAHNNLTIAISDATRITFDSSMNFVTGFAHQKKISINPDCLRKLENPDSSFLIEIYYYSSVSTRPIINSVEFIQSYKKNILNFGNAIVYEYRFNNVAEASAHFMYIIVKGETERLDWEDYEGFVLCFQRSFISHYITMENDLFQSIILKAAIGKNNLRLQVKH